MENSTVKVTITLVLFEPDHIIHVLVFIVNALPEGISGVSDDVNIVTYLNKYED